jgi:RNA polymerase sigma-70 factor (ECF subfamily)
MAEIPTDDELMCRLGTGELRAFGALYDRHKVRVLSFLARLTGDRHIAEDLLQETFLRVWRHRADYRASGQFTPWLFTIARRLVIDHRRARMPEAEAAEALALDAPEAADDMAATHQRRASIEDALAELPAAQREIVLLSRVAGMEAGEIAVVVDSTPGAVRVALHRALKRLRDTLEPERPLDVGRPRGRD